MRYRYFVDFRHGIAVFANFSYGIAVLGTPPMSPSSRHTYPVLFIIMIYVYCLILMISEMLNLRLMLGFD